jgi:hypothetical protein
VKKGKDERKLSEKGQFPYNMRGKQERAINMEITHLLRSGILSFGSESERSTRTYYLQLNNVFINIWS